MFVLCTHKFFGSSNLSPGMSCCLSCWSLCGHRMDCPALALFPSPCDSDQEEAGKENGLIDICRKPAFHLKYMEQVPDKLKIIIEKSAQSIGDVLRSLMAFLTYAILLVVIRLVYVIFP